MARSSVLEELLKSVDYEKAAERIASCVKRYVEEAGAAGVVVGLSGGLDSSVAAALAAKGLGPQRVTALIMPERETPLESVELAVRVAESLGLRYYVLDITKPVEGLLALFGRSYESSDPLARGNVKARIRMTALYYYANTSRCLVVATSDRSEFLLGYFTKWGDAAGDVYPLLSLYKTQVRELGRRLELPKEVVERPSSPELWPGQTAEGELGLPYEILDQLLYLLVDKQEPLDLACEKLGLEKSAGEKVWKRVLASEHKRAPFAKRCAAGASCEIAV